MHLFLHFIQIGAMVAIVSGSCSLFGHSCLGGHGKRADIPVAEEGPRWPIQQSVGPMPNTLDANGNVNPPLQALESLLVLKGIPRSAQHSRYLDRDYDD